MKEYIRKEITNDVLSEIDYGHVMAIAFAEIGAQGTPNYIEIVHDSETQVTAYFGNFKFRYLGELEGYGSVELERIENGISFLRNVRGDSVESTLRGNFKFRDEQRSEWAHVDLRFGNHFFLRDVVLESVLKKADPADVSWFFENGVRSVVETLGAKAP